MSLFSIPAHKVQHNLEVYTQVCLAHKVQHNLEVYTQVCLAHKVKHNLEVTNECNTQYGPLIFSFSSGCFSTHNVGDYHDYCFSKKSTNVVVLGGSAHTIHHC